MDSSQSRGSVRGEFEVAQVAGDARLERIESRVLRIERHLGLSPAPMRFRAATIAPRAPVAVAPPSLMPPPPLPTEALAEDDRFVELMRMREAARTAREQAPRPRRQPPPEWEVLPDAVTPSSPPPLSPTQPPLAYEAKPQRVKPIALQTGWEQVIGLKLAGWVGAIVLVIGLGLGIKYAYDQGWLATVRPPIRLALMYIAGFGLIGAGEVVFRRINKISATGLFGAGIATLFLVSYAGHGYYQLYQRETAFTLMALSTLIGAAVAMRGRLVSIAALALLGGLLAPLVLQGDSHLLTPFFAYLLMLQVVALTLAWWGGSARWWMLRGLSLAGISLWMTVLLLPHAPVHPASALAFAIGYAVLYQLELILSALYPRQSGEEIDAGAGVTFSVIVTALLTAAVLWLLSDFSEAVRGLSVVAISASALTLDLTLRRGRAAVLAYAFRIQSIVLLMIAVPIAFSGSAITIGWAGVAIALAAVGTILRDRSARAAGIVAWGLAVLNLLLWANDPHTATIAHRPWLTLLGQPIAGWTIIAWGLVACGHAIAALLCMQRDDEDRNSSIAMSAIASALFAGVTIAALPPLGATGVMIAYAWLLTACDILRGAGPSPGRNGHQELNPDTNSNRPEDGPALLQIFRDPLALAPQAGVVLLLAAIKWVVIDTLAARIAPGWSPAHYRPILNPLFLTGLAIAGSLVALYRLRRERLNALIDSLNATDATPAVVILALVSLLIALGLSMEVDRVVMIQTTTLWPREQLRQMAWTMLWAAVVPCYLALQVRIDHSARHRVSWRRLAWTLTALLALKFCLLDTLILGLGTRTVGAMPIANFQMLAAAMVVGGLVCVHTLIGRQSDHAADDTRWRVALAAVGVLLWAGTLEIDRLVAGGNFPGLLLWPAWQVRHFAWTAWWTAGIVGFLAAVILREPMILRRQGAGAAMRALGTLCVVLAVKYLLLDTLAFRLWRGPASATVIANLQTFAGACVFAGLILLRHLFEDDLSAARLRRRAGATAMIMLLWLGSLEIDRAFLRSPMVSIAFADPRLAEQVALSIFWSLFAIAAVAFGFRIRLAGLRYFGLTLFALTLMKVALIDLRQAETGYRILSFFGLGGLLLGTSVLYGKLSSTVLAKER